MPQQTVLAKIKELESERTDWFVKQDSLHLIMQYIRQGDFHRVLEIGTHIGYSALNFSLVADHVTTIEKDRIFIVEAVQNCLLSDNIELIQANAFDVLKRFNKEKRNHRTIRTRTK